MATEEGRDFLPVCLGYLTLSSLSLSTEAFLLTTTTASLIHSFDLSSESVRRQQPWRSGTSDRTLYRGFAAAVE